MGQPGSDLSNKQEKKIIIASISLPDIHDFIVCFCFFFFLQIRSRPLADRLRAVRGKAGPISVSELAAGGPPVAVQYR